MHQRSGRLLKSVSSYSNICVNVCIDVCTLGRAYSSHSCVVHSQLQQHVVVMYQSNSRWLSMLSSHLQSPFWHAACTVEASSEKRKLLQLCAAWLQHFVWHHAVLWHVYFMLVPFTKLSLQLAKSSEKC